MKQENNWKKFWLMFAFAATIIILIWIISLVIMQYLPPIIEKGILNDMAEVGDSFGAVNALFSGLALAGIITALVLQKEDLNLQRIELRGARKEFQINRITTVIYKQVEKTDEAIASFKTKIISKEKEGAPGLVEWSLYLDRIKNDPNLQGDRKKVAETIGLHKKNLLEGGATQLFSILQIIESSLNLIHELLEAEELSEEERISLKEIYKKNIPSVLFEVIQKIGKYFEEHLTQNGQNVLHPRSSGDEYLVRVHFMANAVIDLIRKKV